jgi:hypothetical protein
LALSARHEVSIDKTRGEPCLAGAGLSQFLARPGHHRGIRACHRTRTTSPTNKKKNIYIQIESSWLGALLGLVYIDGHNVWSYLDLDWEWFGVLYWGRFGLGQYGIIAHVILELCSLVGGQIGPKKCWTKFFERNFTAFLIRYR